MTECARRTADEWLVVRHMDDELLVYDTRTQRVSALNPLAAAAWRACDGRTRAEDIAATLQGAGMDMATPAAVKDALARLAEAELVEYPQAAERTAPVSSRREALRSLFAGGAVVGSAAVVSLVAPQPAHAASATHCNTDNDCIESGLEFCVNFECF